VGRQPKAAAPTLDGRAARGQRSLGGSVLALRQVQLLEGRLRLDTRQTTSLDEPVGYANQSVMLLGRIRGSVRRVGRFGEAGLVGSKRRVVREGLVSVL
jgi:hypothetical protein